MVWAKGESPIEEGLVKDIPVSGEEQGQNPSEKIIAGWKEKIVEIETAIREGRASEFGGSEAAEKQILDLEDKIRNQENTWRHRAQVIDISKFEEVEKEMQREEKALAEKSPDDDTPLPIAGQPKAKPEAEKGQVRQEAKEAAEKLRLDFRKARNLEDLYAMITYKGSITNSRGETMLADTAIDYIKKGEFDFITNKDGLRDTAKKLRERETYFTKADSLDDLYQMIRDYYQQGERIYTSQGEVYKDAEEIISAIKLNKWGMVTGQMGIRETAMRLIKEQADQEGTKREKPGFLARLFGKK